MLVIPFRWPRPDPVVQDMATREIAKEQPYIHRVTRMAQAAHRRGKSFAFADEVSHIIWSGEVDDWHIGNHLSDASERAGLDFAELEAESGADKPGVDWYVMRPSTTPVLTQYHPSTTLVLPQY